MDEEVFREVKVLTTKQIAGETQEKKLKKDLNVAKKEIQVKEKKILEQRKEISELKSTSAVLKFTKENRKLKEELQENKEELTYLRKFKAEVVAIFKLDKVKEFFESIGLLARIQELLQEKFPQKKQKEQQKQGR